MNRNETQNKLRTTVTHYFDVIGARLNKSANANIDLAVMAEEVNAAFDEQDERLAALEARIAQLEAQQPIAKA